MKRRLLLSVALLATTAYAGDLKINACWPASTTVSCVNPIAGTSGGTGISSTATFPSSGVVVTEAATETLTNKDISATSNTYRAATVSVTGTVSAEVSATAWTPTLSGCSGGTTNISSAAGKYTRVGHMIYADFGFVYNQSGSPTGNITIGGLPTASSADAGYTVYMPISQNQTASGWFSYITNNTSNFNIASDTAQTLVTCAGVTTGRTFRGQVIYRVD